MKLASIAEMQPILCKDTKKTLQSTCNVFLFVLWRADYFAVSFELRFVRL